MWRHLNRGLCNIFAMAEQNESCKHGCSSTLNLMFGDSVWALRSDETCRDKCRDTNETQRSNRWPWGSGTCLECWRNLRRVPSPSETGSIIYVIIYYIYAFVRPFKILYELSATITGMGQSITSSQSRWYYTCAEIWSLPMFKARGCRPCFVPCPRASPFHEWSWIDGFIKRQDYITYTWTNYYSCCMSNLQKSWRFVDQAFWKAWIASEDHIKWFWLIYCL